MQESWRSASCVCGDPRVECSGKPLLVSLCHCRDCQRRTGSVFGVAAFFAAQQVRVIGESARYSSTSAQGYDFDFRFCPHCGSTVYWMTDRKPGTVVVAAGTFADPGFDAPTQSVFTEHQHPWLSVDLQASPASA